MIDLELPPGASDEVKEQVGDYLIEQILLAASAAKDPFSGRSFPRLSKDYAKFKQGEGNPPIPNLEFDGGMLDSLSYELTDKGIELGIFGDEAPKADGHVNFSGRSSLPTRRFLPEELGKLQSSVDQIVRDAIAETADISQDRLDYLADTIDAMKLSRPEERTMLYDFLSPYFPGLTRPAIKAAVLRGALSEVLAEVELLDLL